MDKKHFMTRSKLTIIFIFLIILIDQLIKIFAISITNNGSIEIIKGVLNFTYAKNTGEALKIGSDASTFLLINIIVIFLLIRFLIVNREKVDVKASVALSFILAGGISNLIDRIFRGEVVNFIDISPLVNFPKFNFADICIVVGWILFAFSAAILTSEQLKERKEKINKNKLLKEKIEKKQNALRKNREKHSNLNKNDGIENNSKGPDNGKK